MKDGVGDGDEDRGQELLREDEDADADCPLRGRESALHGNNGLSVAEETEFGQLLGLETGGIT